MKSNVGTSARTWRGWGTMLAIWSTSWIAATLVIAKGRFDLCADSLWGLVGLAAIAAKALLARRLRLASHWSRPVTFCDFLQLAAAWLGSLLLTIIALVASRTTTAFASIVLVDSGFAWGMTALWRAWPRAWREWRHRFQSAGNRHRVLIWGTSDAEVLLVRSLKNHPDNRYRIVGMIAHHSKEVGARIDGVPVVAHEENWAALAVRLGVDELFVVSGSLSGSEIRSISTEASVIQVKMRVLPSYHQLLSGEVRAVPRPVSIEDLLQRKPIELHPEVLSSWIRGRTVLVTGGAGSIGSEIARQLLTFAPEKVVLVDRSEHGVFQLGQEHGADRRVAIHLSDVADENRLERIFARYRPEIVFHAAAYKHVPILETHPEEAVRNIVGATIAVARVSERYGAESLVFISTDKAVAPSSVMGACKRIAERYLQAVAANAPTRMVAVRFGNVLDSAGSVVPVFRDQIARGEAVTVTHPEMRRFFMTIPEAAQLVLHAGAMGSGGEIFVLKMGEPVRIVDLARDLIRLSGLRPEIDVPIRFTGLRPGEKLEEQLADKGESLGPTSHPEIEVVQTSPLPATGFALRAAALVREAEESGDLREKIGELVPEYLAVDGVAKSPRAAA